MTDDLLRQECEAFRQKQTSTTYSCYCDERPEGTNQCGFCDGVDDIEAFARAQQANGLERAAKQMVLLAQFDVPPMNDTDRLFGAFATEFIVWCRAEAAKLKEKP